MVVACTALLVALGGVGVAATPASGQQRRDRPAQGECSQSGEGREQVAASDRLRVEPAAAGPAGPQGQRARGSGGPKGRTRGDRPSDGSVDSNSGAGNGRGTFGTRVANAGPHFAGQLHHLVEGVAHAAKRRAAYGHGAARCEPATAHRTLSFDTAPTGAPTLIVNILAQEFTAPTTTVNLTCNPSGQSQASEAKIVAIKVGSLAKSTG